MTPFRRSGGGVFCKIAQDQSAKDWNGRTDFLAHPRPPFIGMVKLGRILIRDLFIEVAMGTLLALVSENWNTSPCIAKKKQRIVIPYSLTETTAPRQLIFSTHWYFLPLFLQRPQTRVEFLYRIGDIIYLLFHVILIPTCTKQQESRRKFSLLFTLVFTSRCLQIYFVVLLQCKSNYSTII